MKKIPSLWLVALGFAVGSQSSLANWASGGGMGLTNEYNPWFLPNTKDVSYCLIVSDDFRVPESELDDMIASSFKFWQGELASLFYLSGDVRLGTQNFKRAEKCSPQVDVTFQFGNLNTEQQRFLQDPRNYISVAVRTSYDLVERRGRGFVYIAGASGSLRPYVMTDDQPWLEGDGGKLEKVLIHELGHVFGFQHFQILKTINDEHDAAFLMAADYPASLVNGTSRTNTLRLEYRGSLISMGLPKVAEDIIPNCFDLLSPKQLQALRDFFDLKPKECLLFSFRKSATSFEIAIQASRKLSSVRTVGTIVGDLQSAQNDFLSPVSIVLDDVKPPVIMHGPRISYLRATGLFRSRSDAEGKVLEVSIKPGQVSLSLGSETIWLPEVVTLLAEDFYRF